MQYWKYPLVGMMLMAGAVVQADHMHSHTPETGDQTRSWLALQRDGHHASENPQAISGEVATVIYQRFIDSFKHPIPEYYSGEEANSATIGD